MESEPEEVDSESDALDIDGDDDESSGEDDGMYAGGGEPEDNVLMETGSDTGQTMTIPDQIDQMSAESGESGNIPRGNA
jgi:hypothetical protein